MKKTYPFLTILLLLFFAFSLNADEIDVTGDWELVIETPRGEMTQQVKFVQDGDKLTVIMKGQRGEAKGEGTIEGEKIEWTVTRSTPRGDMTSTYKGEVSGDEMSGEVQLGRFGAAQWKATRKDE